MEKKSSGRNGEVKEKEKEKEKERRKKREIMGRKKQRGERRMREAGGKARKATVEELGVVFRSPIRKCRA
jgi:hypothetical protein